VSRRLAAYAVCIEDGRVLLARYVSPYGDGTWWTLPGGGVEPCEDPFDTVTREVAEETGYESVVERLLGVDSRIIPAAERHRPGPEDHQNIGIYYAVRITAGTTRPEPNGETAESVWTPLTAVPSLDRAALVDTGITLARSQPSTGHVPPAASTDVILGHNDRT
jgi:8-oxo-dGTP diphosphatase